MPRHLAPLRFLPGWQTLGIVWIGLTVYLSLAADVPSLTDVQDGDKLEHVLVYAALMGWYVQIYRSPQLRLLCGAGLVALGIALEVLQGFTATRMPELSDGVADALGVALGAALGCTPFARTLQWLEDLIPDARA